MHPEMLHSLARQDHAERVARAETARRRAEAVAARATAEAATRVPATVPASLAVEAGLALDEAALQRFLAEHAEPVGERRTSTGSAC
ncbi:hypothetical protein [Cellulomonas endophytica]|uniref:hypothetical protein n=1 Tax=Cellulomonas endophytica TaxID=2494735 RepID=UPI0010118B22|nr:hypothetical protein [Cellulomonas endophytica]